MKNNNQLNPAAISQNVLIKTTEGLYFLNEAVSKDQLYQSVLEIIEEEYNRVQLNSTQLAKQYIHLKMVKQEREVFTVLFLDAQHRVIAFEELFFGTIDGAAVYPREVVKRCLHHNCLAAIFCHNHPSGVPTASQADKSITKTLVDALSIIDIRVLDHFIVAGGTTFSFAENGLI